MEVRVSDFVQVQGVPTWLPEDIALFWQPLAIEWASNGGISKLKLRYELGRGKNKDHQENIEDEFAIAGDRFILVDSDGTRWFDGHMGHKSILLQTQQDKETYSITAYGPELRLVHKVVYGQWYASKAIDDKEITGTVDTGERIFSNAVLVPMPCVLNPNGEPNMSESSWALKSDAIAADTKDSYVFFPAGRPASGDVGAAKLWTAYKALRTLVEYIDDGDVISDEQTDWDEIETLLQGDLGFDPVLPEVNLEGKNLLEAISEILLPLGYGFNLQPWSEKDADDVYRYKLRAYPQHEAAWSKEPELAKPSSETGNNIGDEDSAEVSRLHMEYNSLNIRNDVRVIGDVQRMECVVKWEGGADEEDLVPGWDIISYDVDTYRVDGKVLLTNCTPTNRENFLNRHEPTGEDFGTYGNVFREYILDTDGAAFDTSSQTADLTGLDSDFDDHVNRSRTFGQTWQIDGDGGMPRNKPAYATIEIAGKTETAVVIPSVVFDRKRAAFRIMRNKLDEWRPFDKYNVKKDNHDTATLTDPDTKKSIANATYLDLIQNTIDDTGLKCVIRLYTSIETDKFTEGHYTRKLTQTWPFTCKKIVRLPNRFRWQDQVTGRPVGNTINQAADALDLASRMGDALEDEAGNGSVMLRMMTQDYWPGMGIPRTSERAIELTVDGGEQHYPPIIHTVFWTMLEGTFTTELVLDSDIVKVGR